MKGLVLVLVLLACACARDAACPKAPEATSADAPDPGADLHALTEEELARKMMELTGASNLGKQVMDAMADSLANTPGLPPGFMEQFKKNARGEDLTELVVPIYVEHYDRDTMTAAIIFYRSPQGQALLSKIPAVTQKSMVAGQEWGKTLARKTLEDMGIRPTQ